MVCEHDPDHWERLQVEDKEIGDEFVISYMCLLCGEIADFHLAVKEITWRKNPAWNRPLEAYR